jgi:hypothetical protein
LTRKRLAAPAQMHDALDEIAKYAECCAHFADDRVLKFSAPPAAALETVKQGIEFIDTPAAERVFELFSLYQYGRARLTERDYDRTLLLYDCARLRFLTHRLFYYARNDKDEEVSEQAEMLTALSACVGSINFRENSEWYSPTVKLIEERHPA